MPEPNSLHLPTKPLRRAIRFLLGIILSILCATMLYLLLAFILGLTPVNRNFKEPAEGIDIFVRTNRVHTDIVVPTRTAHKNWHNEMLPADFGRVDTTFQYIAFGWGDKGFYIHTPNWSDLTFSTAVKALFLPSPTAMHVDYIRRKPESNLYYERIRITEDQYIQLINFIEEYFERDESGNPILIEGANYDHLDNFYEAKGSYHVFNTSNDWTRRALTTIKVRTALWSPFDRAVMYHARKIRQHPQ
jgi:uncharacterized protein (TIGR02117 family)